MSFKVQEIVEAHKTNSVDSKIARFDAGGITQYFVGNNRVEFLQVDTETGEILCIVNGAARHYSQHDAALAARHISNDLTRKNKRDQRGPLRLSLLPCGTYVTLLKFKDQWIASAQGQPVSEQWLVFVRSQLDRFGVSLGELSEQTTYTFLCTRREYSPAQQDAIYLVSEYSKTRERTQLLVPRIEQVQLSTETFLKFDTQWINQHLADIIRTYQRLAFNSVTPIYSLDIRNDQYSWRVLTEAGNSVNQFENQSEHSTFYDFAVANQDQPYLQFYLQSHETYNNRTYTKKPTRARQSKPTRGRTSRHNRDSGRQENGITLQELLAPTPAAVEETKQQACEPTTEQVAEQPTTKSKRNSNKEPKPKKATSRKSVTKSAV